MYWDYFIPFIVLISFFIFPADSSGCVGWRLEGWINNMSFVYSLVEGWEARLCVSLCVYCFSFAQVWVTLTWSDLSNLNYSPGFEHSPWILCLHWSFRHANIVLSTVSCENCCQPRFLSDFSLPSKRKSFSFLKKKKSFFFHGLPHKCTQFRLSTIMHWASKQYRWFVFGIFEMIFVGTYRLEGKTGWQQFVQQDAKMEEKTVRAQE